MQKVELIARRPSKIRVCFYLFFILHLPVVCIKAMWDFFAHNLGDYGDVLVAGIILPISIFLVIKHFSFGFREVDCPANIWGLH